MKWDILAYDGNPVMLSSTVVPLFHCPDPVSVCLDNKEINLQSVQRWRHIGLI